MEIKTCEEYVLSKLFEKENQIGNLNEKVDVLQSKLNSVLADYQCIKDDLYYLINQLNVGIFDGERYVEFDRVWEQYDKEQFTKLHDLITKYSED